MKFYTIYKTTNTLNGKIYIGQHSTTNIDDNYLGSGKYITEAIKEFGKENFIKEILYVFDNFEDMNNKEKELVNSEFIKSDNNYNKAVGSDTSVIFYGSGGYGAAPPSAQGGFSAPNPVDSSLYFSNCQVIASTGLYGVLYDIKWLHNTITLIADDILIIDNEYYMVIRSFDSSIMVKLDR